MKIFYALFRWGLGGDWGCVMSIEYGTCVPFFIVVDIGKKTQQFDRDTTATIMFGQWIHFMIMK